MNLEFKPIQENINLVPKCIQNMVKKWNGITKISEIKVTEIDPKYMGGNDLCNKYGIKKNQGANCVVIEAIRGEKRTLAACIVPVSCKKIDFNGVVRKKLDARRVSLAPLKEVIEKTGMEYGSITPFGLPDSWPILVDQNLTELKSVIIGGGLQKTKISLPGKMLLEIPEAQILTGICKELNNE